MIYAIACCDDGFSLEWIRYCRPGSTEHLKRLKEKMYSVNSTAQVRQIVKIILEKGRMPASKAGHLLCTCLSNKDLKDVIIEDYNLFFCLMDDFGMVDVQYLDASDGSEQKIRRGGRRLILPLKAIRPARPVSKCR
jgi:hypothetical protein